MEFSSAYLYIECATTKREKIAKIDAIIDALLDTALKAAANDNILSYTLDDGQTKINTMYKGTAGVYASIAAFRKLRQVYVNTLNGRGMRLVDSKTFNGRPY
jgi:hypothetical protein